MHLFESDLVQTPRIVSVDIDLESVGLTPEIHCTKIDTIS